MPMLKSLVHVEMTSLEENNKELRENKGRRVHFSGFDCSSIKPPVESQAGSEQNQSDSIDALTVASHHVNALIGISLANDAENKSISTSVENALRSIVLFLGGMDTESMKECAKVRFYVGNGPSCQAAGLLTPSRFAYAQSISSRYPPKRVARAVEMYRKDFESILQRVSTSCDTVTAESITHLEWRLAELTGQCIRFHLRRLFNPPPLPLTTPHSDSDSEASFGKPSTPSLLQSSIFEIIELKAPSAARDSAVADCSISSLFSLALSRIYEFFGAERFQSAIDGEDPISLPESFCTSPGSIRGLGVPQKSATKMPSEDLTELIGDIHHVYSFLGAYKACKFLVDLMHTPGVESEIELLGGWALVEHYGRVLLDQKLSTVCVEDAHFSIIGYAGTMKHFFAKIEDWLSHMEPKVALAEISILQVAKRYKTRITSPKQKRAMFRKFPHVKTIANAIDEGQLRASPFPSVAPMLSP